MHTGDEFIQTSRLGLAATVTDDWFLPPGSPSSAGIVDLPGVYRDILLKEVLVQSDHQEISVLGFGYMARDGTGPHWLMPEVADGFRVPGYTQVSWNRYTMETVLRDIRNIIVRILNVSAANSRSVWTGIKYTPIR